MTAQEIRFTYRKFRLQGFGPLDAWDKTARAAHAAGANMTTARKILNTLLTEDRDAPLLVPLSDDEIRARRVRDDHGI